MFGGVEGRADVPPVDTDSRGSLEFPNYTQVGEDVFLELEREISDEHRPRAAKSEVRSNQLCAKTYKRVNHFLLKPGFKQEF